MQDFSDTIAAVATAPGVGGIGIIRLSGPSAVPIARGLFRSVPEVGTPRLDGSQKETDRHFQHQRIYHGFIVDPDTQRLVDEVMLVYMRTPRSYTREDVIEIQSHAGSAVLQAILGLVLQGGARLAEPGEFTRRAFLNGRIDLTQAEAVIDLIEAKTEKAMHLATRTLTGGMKSQVAAVRDLLERSAAHLEAGIEFCEEVEEVEEGEALMDAFYSDAREALHMVEALIQAHQDGHLYRDGIQVSVVGRPNVGKSSLLNALVQKERAIVTALPGTTRDVVTDRFQVSGIPFEVADTAGMRSSDDLIEKIGIQKTEESIDAAHLILFVLDASDCDHAEERKIYARLRDKKVLLVINKADLVEAAPTLPDWLSPGSPSILVSAKYQKRIGALKQAMVALMVGEQPVSLENSIVPNIRQREALEQAREDIANAMAAGNSGESEEFIVFHLQSALNGLGTITGETHTEDLLDIIFNRFCIGK